MSSFPGTPTTLDVPPTPYPRVTLLSSGPEDPRQNSPSGSSLSPQPPDLRPQGWNNRSNIRDFHSTCISKHGLWRSRC